METTKKTINIIAKSEGKRFRAEICSDDEIVFFKLFGTERDGELIIWHELLKVPYNKIENLKILFSQVDKEMQKGKPESNKYEKEEFKVELEYGRASLYFTIKYLKSVDNYLCPIQQFTIVVSECINDLEDLKNVFNGIEIKNTIKIKRGLFTILKNKNVEFWLRLKDKNYYTYRLIFHETHNENGWRLLLPAKSFWLADVWEKETIKKLLKDYQEVISIEDLESLYTLLLEAKNIISINEQNKLNELLNPSNKKGEVKRCQKITR
jgi:hypothetical protein